MSIPPIDFSKFREVLPMARAAASVPFLVVRDRKYARISKALSDAIGKRPRIYVDDECKTILVQPSDDAFYLRENGFHVRKDGSISAAALCEAVVNAKIPFPARYDMVYDPDNNIWIGTLSCGLPIPAVPKKPMPSKPRKKGLASMMEPCAD